jgi:hypothetical protein
MGEQKLQELGREIRNLITKYGIDSEGFGVVFER